MKCHYCHQSTTWGPTCQRCRVVKAFAGKILNFHDSKADTITFLNSCHEAGTLDEFHAWAVEKKARELIEMLADCRRVVAGLGYTDSVWRDAIRNAMDKMASASKTTAEELRAILRSTMHRVETHR